MGRKENEKITQKILLGAILMSLLLSPFGLIYADDYYPTYLSGGNLAYITRLLHSGYTTAKFIGENWRAEQQVQKRNDIEAMVDRAYRATPEANTGIWLAEYEHKSTVYAFNAEIAKQNSQREKVASTELEEGFYYIAYSDEKKVFFQDGLVVRVEGERVVDEFGNVSLRNSYYNYQYNGKRLALGFESDITDPLGNVSHVRRYGMRYTADSVFYANNETEANQNLFAYNEEITDSAGNVAKITWEAISYEGKCVRAYHYKIEDSAYGAAEFTRSNITYENNNPQRMSSYVEEGVGSDGLRYRTVRTNITYSGQNQIAGYHEEKTVFYDDGNETKITTDATFTYATSTPQFGPDTDPDPDRLQQSIVTTTVQNPDGSQRTITTTMTSLYDAHNQLIGATEHGEFSGQEADWMENGQFRQGDTYRGTSDTQYEVIGGRPMAKQTQSQTYFYSATAGALLRTEDTTVDDTNGLRNNLPRLLSTHEHAAVTYTQIDNHGDPQWGIRDVSTVYGYAPNGNLIPTSSAITHQEITNPDGTKTMQLFINGAEATLDQLIAYCQANNNGSFSLSASSGTQFNQEQGWQIYTGSAYTFVGVFNGALQNLWTIQEIDSQQLSLTNPQIGEGVNIQGT